MDAANRKQMAIDVAKMYYISRKSQEQIAAETGMSRSNISRILKKAVDEGLVEIIVHDNISEKPELGKRLADAFGLSEVIIFPSDASESRMARNVGERLALYLEKIMADHTLLGVGNGKACYYTGRSLQNSRNCHIDVVQLHGNTSTVATMEEGSVLVSLFASKLNGIGYILPAPLMVRSRQTKQELMESGMLHNTIRFYKDVDVAIFEITRPNLYGRNLPAREYLTRADLHQLQEVQVVSCICGYYFDKNGRSCNVGINDRILAISQEQLRKIPTSIGIVIGKNALPSALSAIYSGLINVLAVDEALASSLDIYLAENTQNTLKL